MKHNTTRQDNQQQEFVPKNKVLSLNIRSGGGARVASICQFIGDHKPDIVVLTEWRDNKNGKTFIGWMETQGMHCASLNDGYTENGVLVASRSPFQFASKTPLGGSSAGVLMLANLQGWNLLACYFPCGSAKAPFFSACAEIATTHAEIPFAIIGDLNTGNQLADKNTSGSPYSCAESFDELSSKISLVDLWRHTNGPNAREWTWLSHQNNGFRIDHAFGNEEFICSAHPSCFYDHRPRQENISDHSALMIASTA